MTHSTDTAKTNKSLSDNSNPLVASDRAEILDILRGFALFGILLTHVPSFCGYDYLPPDRAQSLDLFGLDRWMVLFVDFFVDGKFVSLFSLLFGIGFAIQMRHAAIDDRATTRRFRRRLSLLLLIGLAHTFLLWQGDILMYYALLGFVLLTLRHKTPRTLLLFGLTSLMMPALTYAVIYVVYTWLPGILPSGQDGVSGYTDRLEAISSVFANGTYTEVLSANLSFWKIKIQWILFEGKLFTIFGMFLIGAAFGKMQLHYKLAENRTLIRNGFFLMVTFGLAGNAWLLYARAQHDVYPPTPLGFFEIFVESFSRPSLGLAYAAALSLCGLLGYGRRVLAWFAPVGRMALTAYLSQTIICIALFYGYGLGLRDTIGQTEALLTAVVIFTVQSIVCRLWLTRFQYGPVEWIWRQFTYGHALTLWPRKP